MKSIMKKILGFLKARKLELIIGLITFSALATPFFVYDFEKTFFYSVDPDIVYMTNAVLYTKYNMISYADHPGTPTIILLYLFFIPFRLFTKYLLGLNFIQWSFDNFALLTLYARILEVTIKSVTAFIFAVLVKRMTKSNTLTLAGSFLLFALTGFTMGGFIIPENLSLLLTALWLLVFVLFVKKPTYILNLLLIAVSALAVANKFTSLFLLIPSLLLVFYVKKIGLEQKILRLQANLVFAWIIFYLGILPAWREFTYIKNWAVQLFYWSGIHGTGVQTIFNFSEYFSSLVILVKGMPYQVSLIFLTFAMGVFLTIKRKISIKDANIFLGLSAIAGFFVFAKYPIVHYNFVNFFILVYCFIYFLWKMPKKFILATLLVSGVLFVKSNVGYMRSFERLSQEKHGTVYETLDAWTSHWASDIYREQFNKILPKLEFDESMESHSQKN